MSASSGQTIRNSPADAGVAAAAREAIAAADPAAVGLIPLARRLGVSLSRYRNRVRVGRVMDRLEQGESHLADLASELGFADHAHLSRTVRQHLGETPTALRRLLRAH
ncbi:MAG TPA: helix-turn-helix domain-containing protein [Pseudonocardiaceae bacterium]|nr:helix-turn-helix domain-containing protein [Pseudonocardiaceae bacterium]